MPWTIEKTLTWALGYFQKKQIDTARLDAELLLAQALNVDRIQLYVQYDRPLLEVELGVFKTLIQRRASREPLAYILGKKEFFSMTFKVSPSVLIPRPETEELVEHGLNHLRSLGKDGPWALDLGTGSGCILISLLKNIPDLKGQGLDCSASALEIARHNAEIHGVADRLQYFHLDLRASWATSLRGSFDLIVANLPYIAEDEVPLLQVEVKDHEPHEALVSGISGMEAFEWVFPSIATLLSEEGLAIFEIGPGQADLLKKRVSEILPGYQAKIIRDLSGRDRFLTLSY